MIADSTSPLGIPSLRATAPHAEAVIDLDAIATNTAVLKENTTAELMAVVKADGYGHGIVAAAQAVLAGGASWLGVCTLDEAFALRTAGITAPILAWLVQPGTPLVPAINATVDLSAASVPFLNEIATAAKHADKQARVHLKADTGLGRNGAPLTDWPALTTAAVKAQAEGVIDVVGIWSHLAYADEPTHPTIDYQLAAFTEALALAAQTGLRPHVRHLANSAASLTRPDTHFDVVRPGISLYGYAPMPNRQVEFGLRPAMTVQSRVLLTKQVPANHGVSYNHQYRTAAETTLALVPLGYADGVPRAASNNGPVQLAGKRRLIAGRVCMDQFVVDVGDDPVKVGDTVVLFGPGDNGEPTANDWAELLNTISYEIITRIGPRVTRSYVGSLAPRFTS